MKVLEEPLVTQAHVCKEKGGALVLQTMTHPPMKATMVKIDMKCCGLCRTDVHIRDNNWGSSEFPVVLGHEGIGVVRAVKSSGAGLVVGNKVGITWIHDNCKFCHHCLEDRENLCARYLGASAGNWGR